MLETVVERGGVERGLEFRDGLQELIEFRELLVGLVGGAVGRRAVRCGCCCGIGCGGG
jgi:hypothetical protein